MPKPSRVVEADVEVLAILELAEGAKLKQLSSLRLAPLTFLKSV